MKRGMGEMGKMERYARKSEPKYRKNERRNRKYEIKKLTTVTVNCLTVRLSYCQTDYRSQLTDH